MYYLIVTDNKELVKVAQEKGAGVFISLQEMQKENLAAPLEGKNTTFKACELLRRLAIKPQIKGYIYIKYLIEQCEADPVYHNRSITKEIYPECAEQFETTPNRVERAIRHAVESSFESNPGNFLATFEREFIKAPTNFEFIGLIGEYLLNNR